MYRCQKCGRVAAPGEKACEQILESRRQQHPLRIRANRVRQVSAKGVSRVKWQDDPGGIGTAIARRIIVCSRCHAAAETPTHHAELQAACRIENAAYQIEIRRKLEEERRRRNRGRHDDDD